MSFSNNVIAWANIVVFYQKKYVFHQFLLGPNAHNYYTM